MKRTEEKRVIKWNGGDGDACSPEFWMIEECNRERVPVSKSHGDKRICEYSGSTLL